VPQGRGSYGDSVYCFVSRKERAEGSGWGVVERVPKTAPKGAVFCHLFTGTDLCGKIYAPHRPTRPAETPGRPVRPTKPGFSAGQLGALV
jgi:hypothetical protein